MLFSLYGTVIFKEIGMVAIECGGVGYSCLITMNTQRFIPEEGEKLKLFTYLSVREDSMTIFGFYTKEERDCFKTITSVSGVGAKVGLAILSEFSPEEVAIYIASGDSKKLTKASGVGPKLASRIVLELKDKFKNIEINNNCTGLISKSKNIEQAIQALVVLGYSEKDISEPISKLDSSLSVEELIRLTLRSMIR